MSDLVWSKLQALLDDGLNAVDAAADAAALAALQKKYLGKKGAFTGTFFISCAELGMVRPVFTVNAPPFSMK